MGGRRSAAGLEDHAGTERRRISNIHYSPDNGKQRRRSTYTRHAGIPRKLTTNDTVQVHHNIPTQYKNGGERDGGRSDDSLPNREVDLVALGKSETDGETRIDADWGAGAYEEITTSEVAGDSSGLLFCEWSWTLVWTEGGGRGASVGRGREGVAVVVVLWMGEPLHRRRRRGWWICHGGGEGGNLCCVERV